MRNQKFNKYPFIILAVVHIVMLVYTFSKSKDRKRLFVLWLSNIGWAYVFDYLIVSILKGYTYKPNILKNKDLDNVLGAVLSQTIYVPSAALFITAFQCKWKVRAFFLFYFTTIERLFIKWKIFEKHWWSTLYTTISIGIYFILSDKWYEQLKKKNPIILNLSLYHMTQVTWTIQIYISAILGKLQFGKGGVESWKKHLKIAPLYTFVLSTLITLLIKQNDWVSKVKSLLLMMATDFLLLKTKYLKVNSYNVIIWIYLTMFLSSIYYQKLLKQDMG